MFHNLKSFSLLFGTLMLGQLAVEYFDWQWGRYLLKPSFMVLLLVFHILNDKGDKSYFSRMLRMGLLFSWFGDVALMFDDRNPIFFVIGLGAFLIGHIGYALAFVNSIRLSEKSISTGLWIGSIFPFCIFSAVFFFVMQDGIEAQDPGLVIPVLAYTVVITLMGITASLRKGLTGHRDYVLILAGGVLFILSDVVIALNKFMIDIPKDKMLNMVLYLTAQYLITMGGLQYLAYRRGE